MTIEDWTIEEMTGYKPITTFYTDFSVADKFGVEAVRDTYKRVFQEWKHDYKYITELAMVLNWKLWRWYGKNDELSMRETKDQTITRLKRVNSELTERLRVINRQNRSARREERDSIIEIEKKYKTEITNLKNEVIKLQDQIEDERNVWKKELDETKRLLHYWKHKCESKTNNVEERRREEGLSILERDKRERDKVRLEYFEGELWEDKYHYHFFDPYTLILKINPHTGQELNINGTIEILNLIENNSYYVERLEMIQHYLDDHDFDNDLSLKQKVYEVGMDIYRTLYSDFSFDQYSI